MLKTWILTICFLLVPVLPCGWALDTSYAGNFIVPEHQSGFYAEEYEVRVAQKFERGAKNFFLSALEVPHGVKAELHYREAEYLPVGLETVFLGAFKGFFKGIGRAAVGLYEMVTAPYPQGPILTEMEEWLV